jgi:hypothetical protein
MERKAAKELLHIQGWLENFDLENDILTVGIDLNAEVDYIALETSEPSVLDVFTSFAAALASVALEIRELLKEESTPTCKTA